MSTFSLSDEQEAALDEFRQGRNIMISGPAGTGKTFVIREMVADAQRRGKKIQVCATTGCAAVLLKIKGTKTVHSWSGIGLGTGSLDAIVKKVSTNRNKKKPWRETDILIIDEVSMLSARLLRILDEVGQACRSSRAPFGGLQIVLSGDFYQLPPVGEEDDPESLAFCFESELWDQLIESTILLTRIYRQHDDQYAKILNQIRVGRMTKSSHTALLSRVGAECKYELKPTILYPRRRSVDALNSRELAKLDGAESMTFSMTACLPQSATEADKKARGQLSEAVASREETFLKNNVLADQRLDLRVGAQVMCVANIDMEGDNPVVNGSQGIITGFSDGLPVVRFVGGFTRTVGWHEWVSETVPGVGVRQIPLILAWAITIHKAQGVTLEVAEVDAGSGIFECGQTYVALSRVKSLEGLFLRAYDVRRIKVNRKVKEYYESLA